MKEFFHFGAFLVEADRRRLTRGGEPLAVPSKVFDTLLVLLRNRDRVLTKDELMEAVWPDSFVEEANLAQNISTLRKLLGEAPGDNHYIATIPGRGYRFVADVQMAPLEQAEVVLQRQTTTRVVVQDEEEEDAAGAATGQQSGASRPSQSLQPEHATPAKPKRLVVAIGAIVFAVGLVAAGIYIYRTPPRSQTRGPWDDHCGCRFQRLHGRCRLRRGVEAGVGDRTPEVAESWTCFRSRKSGTR